VKHAPLPGNDLAFLSPPVWTPAMASVAVKRRPPVAPTRTSAYDSTAYIGGHTMGSSKQSDSNGGKARGRRARHATHRPNFERALEGARALLEKLQAIRWTFSMTRCVRWR